MSHHIVGTTQLTQDLDAVMKALAMGQWQSKAAKQADSLPDEPGVYIFTLPENDRHANGQLTLRGRTFGPPNARRQMRIQFDYTARNLENTSRAVLYVGKAANLRSRLKMHLNLREDATTNQMLRGLVAQAIYHNEEPNAETALNHILENAIIYYKELAHPDELKNNPRTCSIVGQTFTADRDLLEIKLIAKYAPPYNLKAER